MREFGIRDYREYGYQKILHTTKKDLQYRFQRYELYCCRVNIKSACLYEGSKINSEK